MTGSGQGAALSLALQHLTPCLEVRGQTLYCGELRGAGTGSLWESELLGKPVQQMSRILGYLSLLAREKEKMRSFCRAPTPTPP